MKRQGKNTVKAIRRTVAIGAVIVAAGIGFAGSASASATPVVNTWCPHSEAMHPTWDVNTGEPVICVDTGVTGLMWVPDATR